MSLARHWLVKPLARFGRFLWMSTSSLWPAGLAAPRKRPKSSSPSRRPVRLDGPETLDPRITTDDLQGILTSHIALGGLPLISGQFVTPIVALFQGWSGGRLVPSEPIAHASHTTQAPTDYLESSFLAVLAGLDTTPKHAPLENLATQTSPPGGVPGIVPTSAASQDDWLSAVGNFLDSANAPRAKAKGPAQDNNPPSGGGGGGGGAAMPSATQAPGSQPASFSAASNPSTANTLPPSWATDHSATNNTSTGISVVGPTNSPATNNTAVEQGTSPSPAGAQATLDSAMSRSPLAFEMNVGQTDPSAVFLSHGAGFGLWLTQNQMVFSVPRVSQSADAQAGSDVFRATMVGANQNAEIVGLDPLAATSNYFIGNDPSQYHTNVTQFGRVEYRNVYAGIDLAVHSSTADNRTFEYDFVVHPGADTSAIDLRWDGLTGLRTDDQGRLVMSTAGGDVIAEAPILYQTDAGGIQHNVAGSYVVRGNGEVGFQVTGNYDPTHDLVVDPVLSFSTYLGGSGDDKAYGVAVDASGAAYVTGSTQSNNFPIVNGYWGTSLPGTNVFVTKLLNNQIVYSTYIGNSTANVNLGNAIAVDLQGNAYITGEAPGYGFPTTSGAYKTGFSSGSNQGFALKLSPTGDDLIYSSYLLTNSTPLAPLCSGKGIALDAAGDAFVVGIVTEDITPFYTPTTGAFQTSYGGSTDGFITAFNASGSGVLYSSYLGGGNSDVAYGVAVDALGAAYVVGTTSSTNFPVSTGAMQSSLSGGSGSDAFVAKVAPGGATLTYSTYLGGSGNDGGQAIALTIGGPACPISAYVTGYTNSSNFPTVSGGYQTSNAGGQDAFVSELNPTGTSLLFSTYLGGNTTDIGYGISVDSQGRPTVVGSTMSAYSFPVYLAFQSSSGGLGGSDGFVTRLTPTGTLSYSSYLGGSNYDEAHAVALDPQGSAYVVGYTNSTNFPDRHGFWGEG